MKKQTLSIDSLYSRPIGQIKITLDIEIDRELTEDESYELSQSIQEMSTNLANATLNMCPIYQQETANEREKLLACFGDNKIYSKPIPNGYHNGGRPWFQVTTVKGVIEIGWRKRVIFIAWSNSDIEGKAVHLFPNEDVTKDDKYIHAWNYEKATEYINTLLNTETL